MRACGERGGGVRRRGAGVRRRLARWWRAAAQRRRATARVARAAWVCAGAGERRRRVCGGGHPTAAQYRGGRRSESVRERKWVFISRVRHLDLDA